MGRVDPRTAQRRPSLGVAGAGCDDWEARLLGGSMVERLGANSPLQSERPSPCGSVPAGRPRCDDCNVLAETLRSPVQQLNKSGSQAARLGRPRSARLAFQVGQCRVDHGRSPTNAQAAISDGAAVASCIAPPEILTGYPVVCRDRTTNSQSRRLAILPSEFPQFPPYWRH
jgi:hypothetical protein